MLTSGEKEVFEKRFLLIAAVFLHISIGSVFVEGLFFKWDATQGTVLKVHCSSDFSFFADTGKFEVTVKTLSGRYEKLSVPKSLCQLASKNAKVRFTEGGVSGLVYQTVIVKPSEQTKWRLLGITPIVLVGLLFLAYIPAMLQDPLGRLCVLAICYVANRWLVAVI